MPLDSCVSRYVADCSDSPRLLVSWKAIIKDGDGETYATKGVRMKIHYIAYLKEGKKKFDSSRDRRVPFFVTIGNDDCVSGWEQGMQTMSQGEKAMIHVSSEDGYGEKGFLQAIPPNADLMFEVEIIRIGEPYCCGGFIHLVTT